MVPMVPGESLCPGNFSVPWKVLKNGFGPGRFCKLRVAVFFAKITR